MKKSELRKLVAEYKDVKIKFKKTQNKRHSERLEEIKHRYHHETGRTQESDFSEIVNS